MRPGQSGFDIRRYKKSLRNRYRAIRRDISPDEKTRRDAGILINLTGLPAYRACHTLLTFVSTGEEVDTRELICSALADGKKVAVPYCVAGTRQMDFYLIRSLDELVPRTFGVLEPVAEESQKLTDFVGTLCILPGIVFDRYGYRLGYGGGYYDRFLLQSSYRENGGKTVGICYQDCFIPHLHHGRFDMPCEIIVTEKEVKYAARLGPDSMHSRNKGEAKAFAMRLTGSSKSKMRGPRASKGRKNSDVPRS